MKKEKSDKIERILEIYTKLLNGNHISKEESAKYFGVNDRSIQRDIDDIRDFLAKGLTKEGFTDTVTYDHKEKKYYMLRINENKLTDIEALEVFKILLSSRAFTKEDLSSIFSKLLTYAIPKQRKKDIKELVDKYLLIYSEPKFMFKHTHKFEDIVWAIKDKQYVKLEYIDENNEKIVVNKLKPVSIAFSEYYFYLTGYTDEDFVSIYRVDRIKRLKVLDEKFSIKYFENMTDKKYTDNLQFMTGGVLKKIAFRYIGNDVDYILNKFPNAQIIYHNKNIYNIQIETFGDSALKWLSHREEITNVEII